MIMVVLSVVLSFMVSLLISIFWIFISIKSKYDREKYSIFECGFDMLNQPRIPFSLNFFFVTIIFLIFDVELFLILPFVFNLKITKLKLSMAIISLIFLLLIVGFFYEWLSGMLNWIL